MARGRKAGAQERGTASVEHVGLVVLVGLIALVAIAALGSGMPGDSGRELGSLLARRMACAPLASRECRRDRLSVAYGERLARVVRFLAPDPGELRRDGLTGVDFRYCRRASCARPAAGGRGLRLTTANRRITVFTELRRGGRGGEHEAGREAAGEGQPSVVYWVYRPGQPWQAIIRTIGPAELEKAAGVRLGRDESPILIPLETLPGRNHTNFPRIEEPPWRWRITPIHPGRPS